MKLTFTQHALPFVLAAEGGYSDNPNDSGGPTNMGIEQQEYDRHRKTCGEPARSVKDITVDEASNIYHDSYWTPIQGDDLPFPIDWITFDAAVNMGTRISIMMLDQALGLPEGYAVFASTLLAARSACTDLMNTHRLKIRELAERVAWYHAIVTEHANDSEFLHGWLNRVQALSAQS